MRQCALSAAIIVICCAALPSIASAEVKFAPLDQARIAQIAAMLPDKPHGFGVSYHDRAAWAKIMANPKFARAIPQAEKLLTETYPAWSDDLYLDFSRTGQRPPGEKMLAARQAWLAPLVYAECMEDKGRFVPTVNMVLHELATQKSWTLPAHDGTALNSYSGRAYFVELNSAALAYELSQALYLLDDKVDPKVRGEVTNALQKRIFDPLRETAVTGKGNNWWVFGTNNWNAVCFAGATGAALTALPNKEDRAFFAAMAERYSQNLVDGFGDDGYCTEGLGYFNYGFGRFIVLRETLWQQTGGKLDLFADPKIRKMAMYGPNTQIINDCWPAINDCRFGTKVSPEIMWYCSRTLNLGLRQYESLDVANSGNLVDGCMDAFPNSASEATIAGAAAAPLGLRSYYDVSGILIDRPASGSACNMGCALKGGWNNDSHNHNGIGSYTIVLGDQEILGDPGGPSSYNSKTFGPERYTAFKVFSSYGHPVPLVAGLQQMPGPKAKATIVTSKFADAEDTFAMDFKAAYPVTDLTKLLRTFVYNRTGTGSLTVKTEFSFSSPEAFEDAITTHFAWKQIAPDTLEFENGGEKLDAVISAPGPFTITTDEIDDVAPPAARIGIKLNQPMTQGTITIVYKPAAAN
jgi:hypothetical protein